jgi:glycosyltransferase involved in cell wall biosynthesis
MIESQRWGETNTNLGRIRPSVSVVLCTLNEVANVPFVMKEIPDWVDEIILVDGGSVDGTVERALQIRPRVRVVHQTRPGKDTAVRDGVALAQGEIVVTLDCDGETSPHDIRSFLDPLLDGYDFAKGSRFVSGDGDKSLLRLLGNRVIVRFFNMLYSTRFTDVCSGLNALWRVRAEHAGVWPSQGWKYEPRLVARAIRRKLRVVEVPQHSKGRQAGRSKLPNFRQGFLSICYLLWERFR